MGFMADEVSEVLPEAVGTDVMGYSYVDYDLIGKHMRGVSA